ncbi:MAG: hypothetical protein GY708_21305 [Actinomycetia bacterium]|nr:hypothetical protein [Actinomycetes bacterium]
MDDSTRAAHETTLDPDRHTHLGIWRDEHDDLTRRFFDWNVPELPQPVRQAITTGIQDDVEGMNLDNISDLLEPGYLPLETGMARCANGELSVAIWTSWPGTAPEMVDWWFGWHMTNTERYKLWHPQAHYFAQPRYDLSDLPELSDRKRYIDNTSWVDEYIGPIPSRLAISFHDPADIGLDDNTLGAAGYGTAVCATTASSDDGRPRGRLIHAVRRTPWGSEMRSRFIFPPNTPELLGPALIDHCWTEMTHLATFLPHLYAAITATGPTQTTP